MVRIPEQGYRKHCDKCGLEKCVCDNPMIGRDVLRDDEKAALVSIESREKLNMVYRDDETALLLRGRLIEAREALGEIIPLAQKIKENDEDSDSYEIHCNADFIVEIARKHWKGGA